MNSVFARLENATAEKGLPKMWKMSIYNHFHVLFSSLEDQDSYKM